MKSYHRIIESYVHSDKLAVLVEFGMDSEHTGRLDEVRQVFKDITLHITASDPKNVEELLTQPFVKDPSISVGVLISELATKMHDRLEVVRFVRWDANERETPEETPPRGPANVIRFASGK